MGEVRAAMPAAAAAAAAAAASRAPAGAKGGGKSTMYRVASDASVITADLLPWNKSRSSKTELAKCECCGLGEECTQGYVMSMRERYCGHFVCGLCAEAVKEEQSKRFKSSGGSLEEAVRVHMGVCKQFNCGVRENPLAAAASAMGQLLLRRSVATKSGGPRPQGSLARTTSCMPMLH